MLTVPQSQHQGPSPTIPEHGRSPRQPRELLIVTLFILTNSLAFFLVQYDRMRSYNQPYSDAVRAILNGTFQAPEQYRVGLAYLVHFLSLHAHLRANQSFPLLEFFAYASALWLIYIQLRTSPRFENAPPPRRLALLGFFLAAAQFPVLWIFPWDRPETLPTAFYLAAIVVLLVRRSRTPFAIVCLLALLLSVGQALVRADVSVSAGVAILLAAAMAAPAPRSRSQVAILGLLCAGAGATVQLYLQRVAFPHAAYPPGIPMFQLLANLNPSTSPIHLPEFFTALLPLILCLIFIRRYRLPLDFSDKLVLLLCLIYLPVWIAMGLVVEVRIFVPFLFLASPTIAKVWTAFLLGDQAEARPLPSVAQP